MYIYPFPPLPLALSFSRLRFRIGVLALLNFLFCPVIFVYQILYSFFHYAEVSSVWCGSSVVSTQQ